MALIYKLYKNYNLYLALCMLIFAVGFNLWLYRLEPTSKIDPNDNAFQYALIDRENTVWDFAARTCREKNKTVFPVISHLSFVICHLSFLVDHWVPNWNEGYNLPYYYSHIPQILIVGSWRFLSLTIQQFSNVTISLFQYYHLIIYLLLVLFPLSVFWALRILDLPWLTSGIGALLASQISTDGLYGLDPPSFLWRGYGLSSQLFAMIFLPQAIAYSWKFFKEKTTLDDSGSKIVIENRKSKIEKNKSSLPSIFYHLPLFSIIYHLSSSSLYSAVFFLFATTAGHLGIGIIALFSLIPLAFGPIILLFLDSQSQNVKLLNGQIVKNQDITFQQFSNVTIQQFLKLTLLVGTAVFFLSYWVVPILLNGNYHNISFWDPVWKFNSYGAKEVMVRFFNGDLFDFGRLPVFTLLIIAGFFSCSWLKHQARSNNLTIQQFNNDEKDNGTNNLPYFGLALLFMFWLLLYFGRTTWGSLIDIIPGMKDFHLSRFIVGLHLAGLFLAPIGAYWILEKLRIRIPGRLPSFIEIITIIISIIVIIFSLYPQTIKYNDLNNKLILQANGNFDKAKPEVDALFKELRSLPAGRVFAGRGGSWGKNFKVAETPMYMELSTYGIPTVLWLPETWSPNADVEQFFSENKVKDYNLFNITYVATPPDQPAEPFWQLIKTNPRWKLYQVKTQGYITSGILLAIVSVKEKTYVNIVHLWIQSDAPPKGLYPELTFAKDYPKTYGLPNFKMVDEANYMIPDGSLHNIFREPPVYLPPDSSAVQQCSNLTISSQKNDSDMIFKANISKTGNDPCLIILKQSFHPDWRVMVDGQKKDTLEVFPSYVATILSEAGTHEIVFSYKPSELKILLIIIELIVGVFILLNFLLNKPKSAAGS